MVIAIEAAVGGLLRPDQNHLLQRLGGRVLSVGAQDHDVTTTDTTYTDWVAQSTAPYAIIRPDFYVAATAASVDDLRQCFDDITEKLGLT